MAKQKGSENTSDSVNHSGFIENNPEVQSYIYQQINEFNPYVTPETIIMVISRDPQSQEEDFAEDNNSVDYKHRIAIVLQEQEATLEAEACHDDIYEAIKLAKTSLIDRLVAIQSEMEENKDEELDHEVPEISTEHFH